MLGICVSDCLPAQSFGRQASRSLPRYSGARNDSHTLVITYLGVHKIDVKN
jgi:hypothetical protein